MPLDQLTPAQLRVLELLAQGFPDKAIGVRLSIGLPSVRSHIHRMTLRLALDPMLNVRVQLANWYWSECNKTTLERAA